MLIPKNDSINNKGAHVTSTKFTALVWFRRQALEFFVKVLNNWINSE
jgi:hypothetical protein